MWRLRGFAVLARATITQRLYLNGARVAQMSDTQLIDLNSAALGIGRDVSGIADLSNRRVDAFRLRGWAPSWRIRARRAFSSNRSLKALGCLQLAP